MSNTKKSKKPSKEIQQLQEHVSDLVHLEPEDETEIDDVISDALAEIVEGWKDFPQVANIYANFFISMMQCESLMEAPIIREIVSILTSRNMPHEGRIGKVSAYTTFLRMEAEYINGVKEMNADFDEIIQEYTKTKDKAVLEQGAEIAKANMKLLNDLTWFIHKDKERAEFYKLFLELAVGTDKDTQKKEAVTQEPPGEEDNIIPMPAPR